MITIHFVLHNPYPTPSPTPPTLVHCVAVPIWCCLLRRKCNVLLVRASLLFAQIEGEEVGLDFWRRGVGSTMVRRLNRDAQQPEENASLTQWKWWKVAHCAAVAREDRTA